MKLPYYLEQWADIGVDAFIVADIGVLSLCKKHAPNVPVHISTQAGIVNYVTANEFYNMGASRVHPGAAHSRLTRRGHNIPGT